DADLRVPAEDRIEQRLLAHDSPRVLQEHFEELELSARKLTKLPRHVERSSPWIVSQTAERNYRMRGGLSPAEERPNSRFQLGEVERFSDVVIRSKTKSEEPLLERIFRGENEDRR